MTAREPVLRRLAFRLEPGHEDRIGLEIQSDRQIVPGGQGGHMGTGDCQSVFSRFHSGGQDRVLGKFVMPVFNAANDQRQARGEATGRQECNRVFETGGRKLLSGLEVQPVQKGLTGCVCRACYVNMAEHGSLRET